MKIYFQIIVLIVALIMMSCERETDTFKGPSIGYPTNDFAVTQGFASSTASIDFSIEDSVKFTARFNEEVAYTITLTGEESGAVQQIVGVSDAVDTIWSGDAQTVFFKEEKISVQLTVLGRSTVVASLDIEIEHVYTPVGVGLSNFEAGGTGASCWFPGMNQVACDNGFVPSVSLEGVFAHQVKGVSVDKPGDQFVGLATISPKIGTNNDWLHFAVPNESPDQLYFNIFIFGTGDDNVAMFIKFMQDDDGNGSHDPLRENGFEMQLTDLSHVGWKKFSFKYGEVPLGGNTDFGGNGDGIYRPSQISKIELGLWALKNPDNEVEFIYDYAVFTSLKPFGE